MDEKAREAADPKAGRRIRNSGVWWIGWASIAFIILVMASCLVFANNTRSDSRESALTALQDYASAAQTSLVTRLNSDFGTLNSIAVCISAIDYTDIKELQPLLDQINRSNEFTRMGFVSPEGKGDMLDLNGSIYSMDFSGETFFQSALAGKSAMQNTVKDPHGDGWIVHYATPVMKDGTVAGVLVANHSAAIFSNIVDLQQWRGYGYANITDSTGRFAIRSNSPLVAADILALDGLGSFSAKGRADLANAFDEDGGVFGYSDSRGEIMYAITKPIGFNDWYVVCSLTESYISAPFIENARFVMTALISATLLFLIMVVLFMRMIKRKQDELERRSAENAAIISQSGKHLKRYDISSKTIYYLGGSHELFGLPQTISDYPESILTMPFIPPDSREDIRSFYAAMCAGEPAGNVNIRIFAADGKIRWYHADYVLLPDEAGRLTSSIIAFFDNTELREKELAYELRQSERIALIQNCRYYLEADLMSGLVVASHGELLFPDGVPQGQINLRDMVEWDIKTNVYPKDVELFREFFDKNRLISLNARGVYEDSLEFRTLITGSLMWHRATIQMAQHPGSNDARLYIIFKDVHAERSEKDNLKEQASRDSLTGLLNHAATFGEISRYLTHEGASGNHALFMIDIDDFKQINDTMGHQFGDQALSSMANALRRSFRGSDVVGRIGGDEFFALMKNASNVSIIEDRVRLLLDELQHLFADGSRHISLSGSVGIAMYHSDIKPVKTLGQLYAEADAALYKAKALGKNRYAFADDLEKVATISPKEAEHGVLALSLRGLLNNLGSGVEIYHGTPNGILRPMFCNHSFLKLAGGLTEEEFFEIYGQDAFAGAHPDDREELVAVYELARHERSSFRHNYRIRGAGGEYYYVTIFANFVFFDDGSFDFYAIYSDAEQIMRTRSRLENRYRAFREEELRTSVGALVFFRLNLTADRYEAGEGEGLEGWTCTGAEELLTLLRSRLDHHADLEAFGAMFSRQALLTSFEQGETQIEKVFPYLSRANEFKWRRIQARLAQNPDTNDVEAQIAFFDVDREIRLESMMEGLVDKDYEFLGQVDVATGRIRLFGGRVAANLEQRLQGIVDYDQGLAKALKEVIPANFYEESLTALGLARIIQELAKSDEYVCVFPNLAQDDHPAGFKKWRYFYTDERRNTIMISRTNVTDTIASERDTLTGLLNRHGFYRQVRDILRGRPDTSFRILRFDIDNFKLLNETLGYGEGDRFLDDLGAFLRKRAAGENADVIFARLDADHFASLRREGEPSAETIMNELDAWMQAYPIDFTVTAHMGVYRIDDADMEVSVMCDRALLALKSIKGDYTKRVAYFDDSMRNRIVREQALAADMENALRQGQFEVYFQPQYNYEDQTLIGAEALVRWIHPQRGIIPPGEFIPLFERNGFITQLDEYIWDRSCAYLRKWMDDPGKRTHISVSVNISRKDMNSSQLANTITAITRKHNVPVSMLKLEITESAYMQNPEQVISMVHELHQAGFSIEMDDFGTGYSSLNTLKDVPVDVLKLDMKFLRRGMDDERGGNILSSVIRMAHWLKIPIIAEGVENKAQADYLKSLGCVYMQGFFFAKPMPAAEFEKLLEVQEVGDTDRYCNTDLTGVAAFWDPSTQTELLFNSLVGGASILEYRDGHAEILRANDKFYEQIEITRLAYQEMQLNTLARFDDEQRAVFVAMLQEAIRTGEEAECDVQSLPLNSKRRFWTHNRIKLLAQNGDSYLFFMATENIDKRIEMEEQLRVRTEALQLSIANMGRAVCIYDIAAQILTLPEEYARSHGFASVLRDEDHLPSNTILTADKAKYLEFYRRIKAGEPAVSILLRIANVAKRENYAWERLDSVTIFADDGTPLRAVITCEDITAQKEQEAEIVRNDIIIAHTNICLIDYDVPTDLMRFQSGPQKERQLIADYFKAFLDTEMSRIHPDYKEFHRGQFRALIEGEPASGCYDYIANNWGSGYRWSRLNYVSIADDSGKVYRIVGQISDIQKEKDDEALIAKLNQSLQIDVPGHPFNATMAERLFTLLFTTDEADVAIYRVLELLGEYYGLSRAYIFEDSPDNRYTSNTIEWCATGVASEQDNLQNISYEQDMGGVYHGLFDKEGIFFCKDIEQLPPLTRDTLAAQGIKSVLQCALTDAGKFVGFVGFDECRINREWNDEQVGTLALVAHIVGIFLMKQRRQEQAGFSEDFKAALDNNASFIYIIDPETYEVVYSNQAVRNTFHDDFEGRICYREFIRRETACENCPVPQALRGGAATQVEVLRPDGMLVLTQASPMHWNGRALVLVTCVDVTEMRRLRDELARVAQD